MSWDDWNNGVYLAEAHTRFGDKDTVRKLNENTNPVGFANILDRIQDNADKGLEGFDILKDVVKPDIPKRKLVEQLEKKLKEDLLRNVRKGMLIAFGFSVPRHANDIPQRVPNDLWERYLFSSSNVLKSSGLRMEAIKLVPSSTLEVTTTPSGRPSRQEQIAKVFHILNKQGQIDFSRPISECYPIIRAWILENDPDNEDGDVGLGVKAMERHVNPIFKNAKKNSL